MGIKSTFEKLATHLTSQTYITSSFQLCDSCPVLSGKKLLSGFENEEKICMCGEDRNISSRFKQIRGFRLWMNKFSTILSTCGAAGRIWSDCFLTISQQHRTLLILFFAIIFMTCGTAGRAKPLLDMRRGRSDFFFENPPWVGRDPVARGISAEAPSPRRDQIR